jgi:putative membrane protein
MYGPWQGNPPYVHHDAWWGFFHLLPIVLFLVVIGVAVWAVLRFSSRPVLSGGAAAAVAAPARDPAMEELRIRYARGELGRDDFAQRMRDLGSHDIGPTQPSPTPNDAPAPGRAAAGDG